LGYSLSSERRVHRLMTGPRPVTTDGKTVCPTGVE
jgi:hypothetical protein